jgi:L-alanine-DL-glutamate epimerase-like enolase superfamily enzyme
MACPMKFSFRRFELKLTRTWRIATGVGGAGTNTYGIILVELADDQGRRGIGEAASTSRYGQPIEVIEAFMKKVDASRLSFDDLPGSMKYLDSVASDNDAAKCALNIALLDGIAKAAKQPIHDFLKLGFTEKKHVTSFSIGIDTPEVIREKVREAERYPVLKLKVGSPDDRANFAALREAAPTKPVRVDANEAWKTKEEALRNIEWLHHHGNIQFIEQPMPATSSRADLAWLKERSPMLIFGDESYHHASDIDLAAECFHGVNVKLVKTGGISGAYDALQAARKRGLKTMIGCMIESSVLITAAAHLAELTDHLDIDGNILINNDPYLGATAEKGIISFASAPEKFGLRVKAR